MVRHFEHLLRVLSVESREQSAETFVESSEQGLAHSHAAVHGHGNRQDLRVLAEWLKDLVPYDLVDELVAPAVGRVECPDIIEFFQGFAVAFFDRIEVAIEIDM